MSARAALAAWRAALGAAQVETDAATLAAAATATFATAAPLLAILRPGDADEAAAALAIAHRHRVALHPVSRGLNWGLGSRAPPRPAALLDFGRLDRIRSFDEAMACVTVEPGVTFAQLDAFLRARTSALFLPAIGGSPHASIAGNALQRGHGIGPASRRAAAIGAVEGLLADGARVSTGYLPGSAFSGAEAHRHGAGPSLAGLVQQGGPAVVTAMTLTLESRPALLVPFHGEIGGDVALCALLEALRPLLLSGALGRHLLTVWNSAKRLAAAGRYPWAAMGDAVPLDLARIRERPGWHLAGALYAPSAAHAAAAAAALESLRPLIAALDILDPAGPDALAAAPQFLGAPGGGNLASMAWRKRGAVADPPAPEADRCGVLQLCPLLPLGHAALPMLAAIDATAAAHGFEAQTGFDCGDPRLIEAFVTLAYDRDIPGEDGRALACHDAILDRLATLGSLPYRLGIQSAGRPLPGDPSRRMLIGRVTAALDPAAVLTSPAAGYPDR